jgi:hypothetical protein
MRTPRHPDTILVKNEFYPNGLKEIDTYNYYESVKDKLIVEVSGRDLIIFLAIDNRILVLRHGKTTRYVRLNRGNFDDVFHARMLSVHCSMHEVDKIGIIDIDCSDFKRAKQATKDTYDYVNEFLPFVESSYIKYTGKNSFHIVCTYKRDLYVDRAKVMIRNYLEESPLAQDYAIDEVRRADTSVPNLDLAPNKFRGGYIALHSLSTLGLKCMKVDYRKVSGFKKEDAIIPTK